MIGFIEKVIREQLNIREEICIERAHRAASGGSTARMDHTRSIIVGFRSYKEKQQVLQAAWSQKAILINDHRIYFDEDYTTEGLFTWRARARAVPVPGPGSVVFTCQCFNQARARLVMSVP